MRFAVAALSICAAALAVVSLAPAKENARARLAAPVRLGAVPGTTIRVQWTVQTRDDQGRLRPFRASGMFVRLLSRTGAAETVGLAGSTSQVDGRYTANLRVPAGGIGGIRIGLRGWNDHGRADIYFPLENDPFASPGDPTCDVTAVRSTLAAFVRAYNRGDFGRLDLLFSREGFVWYFATGPDRHLRKAKQNRETLLPYFRARHRSDDRLTVLRYRFNGYDRERGLGHFQLHGRRRADDVRQGDWIRMGGKGALDCSRAPVTIALLLVGGET